MDDKEPVFLTIVDLSAAFGTADLHVRVNCLRSCFGITEGVIQWIQSYFHDRHQKVSVNGKECSPQLLECCVPQSSLLGPLFYSDNTRPLGHLLH